MTLIAWFNSMTNRNYHAGLSLAVDVYADWVDACDAVAKATANPPGDDDKTTSKGKLTAGNGRRGSGQHSEVAIDGEDSDEEDYDKAP